MTDSDRLILTTIIAEEQKKNEPRSNPQKYFEYFTAEQILKESGFDLDPEQIRSGIVGRSDDGGVDSIFLFANRRLVREDNDLSIFKDQQISIELLIVQSKHKPSFAETTVTKLADFTEQCLPLTADLSAAPTSLYNQLLLDAVGRFHTLYKAALTNRPKLSITYYYATLGEEVHAKVETRKKLLIEKCRSYYSVAEVDFQFAGAARLFAAFNRTPTMTLNLPTTKHIASPAFGSAFICIVPLKEFYKFITNNGVLRGHIFEANVRDYQGDVAVNKEIAATLSVGGSEEFWWLNNGITIIASKVVRSAGELVLVTDPLIVNGLQTSYEIFNRFQKSDVDDGRAVSVRIIENSDPQSIDRIIKATNSQTQIPKIWLHATEDIHRKIEAHLRTVDLFYDRRKNHYRNQGKPASKIVTLPYLSQAMAAIVLQKPDDARARPTTVAERHYSQMFSDRFPIGVYAKTALLMKRVDDFLDGVDLERGDRNNLSFYVAMMAACEALKTAKPRRDRIAALDITLASDELLEGCLEDVKAEYIRLGGTDQIAKGPTLVESLKNSLAIKFQRGAKTRATLK